MSSDDAGDVAGQSGAPRLHVAADLAAGAAVPLDKGQLNYLGNVLRLKPGDAVKIFNGRHGEWLCAAEPVGRKDLVLRVIRQLRLQPEPGDLQYYFAPLKSARLDYMAQKAVEMGASLIGPVLTRRTQVSRINADRLLANAIEAAEQCGILAVPKIAPERKLIAAIEALEADRLLIFCDEEAEQANPSEALRAMIPNGTRPPPLAVLIGPEGGFDPEERRFLVRRERVVRLSLGPRILRADTAAVAALAIVQSTLGDWH